MSKIYISAGHGGKDPGGVSGEHREKNYTLPISLKVGEQLKAAGHEIFYTRTNDKFVDVNDRAKEANKLNVDLVLDIHLNSFINAEAHGTETFYSRFGGLGKNIAVAIAAEIAKLGYHNRGAKTRINEAGNDFYGMIRQTKAPAVIAECCFIKNIADMEKMNVDKVAKAIVTAVLSVIGGKQPEPVKPDPKPEDKPAPIPATGFAVGDIVKIKDGAKDYNGTVMLKSIYSKQYRIDALNGDRAVLDKNGIHSAFKTSDLSLVASSSPAPAPKLFTMSGFFKIPNVVFSNADNAYYRRGALTTLERVQGQTTKPLKIYHGGKVAYVNNVGFFNIEDI